jgi:hypothetical protein
MQIKFCFTLGFSLLQCGFFFLIWREMEKKRKRLYNNYLIYRSKSFTHIKKFTIIYLHEKINTIWFKLPALVVARKKNMNQDHWASIFNSQQCSAWNGLKFFRQLLYWIYTNITIFYAESQLIKLNTMIKHKSSGTCGIALVFLELLKAKITFKLR